VALEPVPRPAPDATATNIYWLVSESATRGLATGRYRVAVVSSQTALRGWRAEPGEFLIVAANPDRPHLIGHLRIQRSIALGKTDDALAEAGRLIAANAQDKNAWIAKGDIFMLKDDPDAAQQAYDSALDDLHKKAEGEPIALKARRRNAFFRSLEKRGVVTPTPPAP
jgi:hypothetical protein